MFVRNLNWCILSSVRHQLVFKRVINLPKYQANFLHKIHMAASQKTDLLTKPLVAVAQMTCTADKSANREQAVHLIDTATSRGAQMVFLPECFDMVGETKEMSLDASETLDGDTILFYRKKAKEKGVWLSLGGFHERPANFDKDRRLFNTHLLVDSDGEIRAEYRKTHLFDVDIKGGVRLKETDHTRPGPEITAPVESPIGRIGLGIVSLLLKCYDLRFPEMSVRLRQQGAHVLTYPSAFTVPTGMAHWHTLLRSRAIETQCYVIAAAQIGKHNAKRTSYGHALIVDPWGAVVAECSDKPGVALAQIDLDYLQRRRADMPVMTHRRPELYPALVPHEIDTVEKYTFGQVSVPSSCVFYKTALTYAFVNRKPVLPGHMLVSALRPVERFCDLHPGEVADMWLTAQRVAKVVEEKYSGTSLTLAIQDGVQAGQSIKHVHVHILPRKEGDFDNNDDIYHHLEKHDKAVREDEWRTYEDMAAEASTLRPLFDTPIPQWTSSL